MRKILLGSFIGLIVLTATGCEFGKKGTITCTLEPVNELVESIGEMPKQEIIIDYKGSKITKATGNYIYSSNEAAKEEYDSLMDIAKNDKARTDFKLDGNKILDVSNTDDVIDLALGNSDNKIDKKKDKVISSLKAQGYTCK